MEIRKLRQFAKMAIVHLDKIGTREDFRIILEIAFNHEPGNCLTLKQLVLSGIAPESTIKRRLGRLVKQGLIVKFASNGDRRLQHYQVPPRTLETLRSLARDLRSFDWS